MGKPSNQLPPSPRSVNHLAVISETPLDYTCGQIILSGFISSIAEKGLLDIGGVVRVRGGEEGVKSSFGLRHSVLDKLVDKVEETGLANTEEVFLSIALPLQRSGKLPITLGAMEAFQETNSEIDIYLKGGRFEQAEPLLLWLQDAAGSSAHRYEVKGKWSEACGVYLQLCMTYDRLESGGDYANGADISLGLFYERMLISLKTSPAGHERADRIPLDVVPTACRPRTRRSQIYGPIGCKGGVSD